MKFIQMLFSGLCTSTLSVSAFAIGLHQLEPKDSGSIGGMMPSIAAVTNDGIIGGTGLRAFIYKDGNSIDLGSTDNDDATSSGLSDLSDDGKSAIGWTIPTINSNREVQAFRWNEKDGMTLIDLGVKFSFSSANAMSEDGSSIVGSVETAPGVKKAFLWTKKNGLTLLSDNSFLNSTATSISSDGSVIVGQADLTTHTSRAFLWTQLHGLQNIGTLGQDSYASKVSADGKVAVGVSKLNNNMMHAYRWTQSDGIKDLGTLGGNSSSASSLSADGSIVVGGASNSSDKQRAFYWTNKEGMTDLGTLGGDFATASAISKDGSIIAGLSDTAANKRHIALWKVSTTEPQQNQGNGNLRVIGSIIAAPCSLDTDSQSQSISLGQVSRALLQNGGSSTPKNFSLRLTDCDVSQANTVSVTFTGVSPASVGNSGLALSGGSAKGAYIALSEGTSGLPVKLGEPTQSQRLSAGNNQMSFSAVLKGISGSEVIPGDFTAVVNFSLAYL